MRWLGHGGSWVGERGSWVRLCSLSILGSGQASAATGRGAAAGARGDKYVGSRPRAKAEVAERSAQIRTWSRVALFVRVRDERVRRRCALPPTSSGDSFGQVISTDEYQELPPGVPLPHPTRSTDSSSSVSSHTGGKKQFLVNVEYSTQPLARLPESLLHYIALRLDLRTVVSLATTCKLLHNTLFLSSAHGVFTIATQLNPQIFGAACLQSKAKRST